MADLAAMCCYCHRDPIDFGGMLHKALQVLFSPEQIRLRARWMAVNHSWQLSLHTHFNRKSFFFLLQKVASHPNWSALPLLPCTNTDQLSATIPKFTTTPRPSRWARPRVPAPARAGTVELGRNSLQGSSECQSGKVNNKAWHCCVTVYYFHCAPYGNMSGFTASPCWHVCPSARRALPLLRCLGLILGCWEVSPPVGFSWQRCHLTFPSERAGHAECFSGSDSLANTQCTHWFLKMSACKIERTFKASQGIF